MKREHGCREMEQGKESGHLICLTHTLLISLTVFPYFVYFRLYLIQSPCKLFGARTISSSTQRGLQETGGLIVVVSMGNITAQVIIIEAGLLSTIFAKDDSGYCNSNALPAWQRLNINTSLHFKQMSWFNICNKIIFRLKISVNRRFTYFYFLLNIAY